MINAQITNSLVAPQSPSPIQKQVDQKSTNSFYIVMDEQNKVTSAEPKTISNLKMETVDGNLVDLGEIVFQPKHFKPATVESLQKDLGITKAAAEEILRPKPVLSDEEEQKIMESSPAYIAATQYSNSAQVEMVARDNNGQIIAVLWKDGSAFAESNGVLGNTPAETRANLLKMPNVHLERYDANQKSPTRLEIEAEQMAFTKKHPELFQQIPDGLLS